MPAKCLTKRKSFRVPDPLAILLDQNVPQAVASWLKRLKPTWAVFHTGDVGLSGKADETVFAWAQQQAAVIVTFDEDFANGRSFPAQRHHGIVRLRVWPTTMKRPNRLWNDWSVKLRRRS